MGWLTIIKYISYLVNAFRINSPPFRFTFNREQNDNIFEKIRSQGHEGFPMMRTPDHFQKLLDIIFLEYIFLLVRNMRFLHTVTHIWLNRGP